MADGPRTNGNMKWRIVALGVLLSALIFAADLAIPLGVAMGVPYLVVVLLSLWIPGRRWIWGSAGYTSALIIVGYFLSDLDSDIWKVLFNRALALGAIWTTATLVNFRKVAEQRIAETGEFNKSILNNAVDAILTINHRGIIEFANPAVCKLFGYSPDELFGHNLKIIVPEPHKAEHDRYIREYMTTGVKNVIGFHRELTGLHRDGTLIPIELSVSEFKLGDQPVFTGIIHDISERKEWEKQIQIRTEELETTNRELDEFTYAASHDLKAPLRGIDHLTNWIREDASESLPEESKRHLEMLSQRSKRMESLIDELLQYSRVGRMKYLVEEVDTAKLCREITEMLDIPNTFTVSIAQDLPVFRTWKVPFEQVLRNLIENAVKHHDRDTGRIDVSAKTNGTTYEFKVRDDGPGIREEYHARSFKMFQTLKPRDEVEGSGMGLALVKKIVEIQGGHVHIEPNDGKRGLTFCFTWPNRPKET